MAPDDPVVPLLVAASRDAGRPTRVSGTNGWHDGATFTLGGTPSVAFGPGDGAAAAHIVDEYMAIDDLVAASQALALAAWRYCGRA